jgi:hypothetical protein
MQPAGASGLRHVGATSGQVGAELMRGPLGGLAGEFQEGNDGGLKAISRSR